MANVDAPRGFTPAYHQSGGLIRAREYRIADDYSENIFNGDVVTLTTDGTIIMGAASTPAVGVFAGCSYTKDNGEIVYSPYWADDQSVRGSYATAYVYDDANIVYIAQLSSSTVLDVAAGVGTTADLLATGGSTTTGRSAHEVDSTDATDVLLKIMDFVKTPDNDPSLAHADVYVMIAEHQYAPTALGVDDNT